MFVNGDSTACHLKFIGQPVTWVLLGVKHFGNIVTSDLTDARGCAIKRSISIGSINKRLGSYGTIQSNDLCELFQISIAVPSMVQNYGVATHVGLIDA